MIPENYILYKTKILAPEKAQIIIKIHFFCLKVAMLADLPFERMATKKKFDTVNLFI